jgi:hypothetical protein
MGRALEDSSLVARELWARAVESKKTAQMISTEMRMVKSSSLYENLRKSPANNLEVMPRAACLVSSPYLSYEF